MFCLNLSVGKLLCFHPRPLEIVLSTNKMKVLCHIQDCNFLTVFQANINIICNIDKLKFQQKGCIVVNQ